MAKVEPARSEPQKPAQPASTPPKKAVPKPAGEIGWHPVWRWLVSLLIVLHITAVFCAPWDLSTDRALPPGYIPPTDNLGRQIPPALDANVWQEPIIPRTLRGWFFRHYLNLLYLNHGYEFFAPDPNGSNLIRYQIRDSGGREIASGEFPDLKSQWPRLLYHRHMMLAAQTGDMGEESGRHYAQHLACDEWRAVDSHPVGVPSLALATGSHCRHEARRPRTPIRCWPTSRKPRDRNLSSPIALPPTEGGR